MYVKLDGNGFLPDAELELTADRDEDTFLVLSLKSEDGDQEFLIVGSEVDDFEKVVAKGISDYRAMVKRHA